MNKPIRVTELGIEFYQFKYKEFYDSALAKVKSSGFERMLRPKEFFKLCSYAQIYPESEINKTLSSNQWLSSAAAVDSKSNTLKIVIDPTNFVRNKDSDFYDLVGLFGLEFDKTNTILSMPLAKYMTPNKKYHIAQFHLDNNTIEHAVKNILPSTNIYDIDFSIMLPKSIDGWKPVWGYVSDGFVISTESGTVNYFSGVRELK
jgi:hypothetical protein